MLKQALIRPKKLDLSIFHVIKIFSLEARKYREELLGVHFADAVVAREILNYIVA